MSIDRQTPHWAIIAFSRNYKSTVKQRYDRTKDKRKMLRKLCFELILVSSAALIISYVTCGGGVDRPTDVKSFFGKIYRIIFCNFFKRLQYVWPPELVRESFHNMTPICLNRTGVTMGITAHSWWFIFVRFHFVVVSFQKRFVLSVMVTIWMNCHATVSCSAIWIVCFCSAIW